MLEQERVKLHFGPYRTPKCKVGRRLRCVMRGKVTVAGLSDALIQWPYVPQPGGNGYRSLILCGDLIRAVRRESETAVAHWWGVSRHTVLKWRKALGVEKNTDGTRDLARRWAPERILNEESTRKRMESLKYPERAEPTPMRPAGTAGDAPTEDSNDDTTDGTEGFDISAYPHMDLCAWQTARAIQAGLPTFERLLEDTDREIAAAAAKILLPWHETRQIAKRSLIGLIEEEPEPK